MIRKLKWVTGITLRENYLEVRRNSQKKIQKEPSVTGHVVFHRGGDKDRVYISQTFRVNLLVNSYRYI